MSKIREKESLECGRMHIWALKTQKLPGPLSGPWTPAAICSLRSRDSASLCRQLSASEPGAPPWPNPGSAPVFRIPFKHNRYLNIDLDGKKSSLSAHFRFSNFVLVNQKLKKKNSVVRILIWICFYEPGAPQISFSLTNATWRYIVTK